MPNVVIFIPGIMGSVLKLGEEVIWPGPIPSLVLPYNKMRELLNPDLVATDCVRSFVFPQYKSLIDDLETCGFSEKDQTLVIGAYDWRKSIEYGATGLAKRISKTFSDHGNDVKISLVAHSMGGLVCRFFLESGRFNTTPGWGNVCNLITLATPHRGAAIAVPLVLGLEKRLFLSADQVLQLASDERYPAAYQLLPRPGEPIAWDWSGHEGVLSLDIYDRGIMDRLGLSPKNIIAAQDFHTNLNAGSRPVHVRYFCFSGNRELTTAYIKLQPQTANRLFPAKVEQESTGDGTVPIWSSTLPNVQFLYVAGEHGTIYKTRALRRTLASLLGREGLLAAGAATEIVLRKSVVEPETPVYVKLNFGEAVDEVDGRIAVEHLVLDANDSIESTVEVTSYPLQYRGPIIEELSLVFNSPENRGYYRIAFFESKGVEPSAYAELIVQNP